MTESAPTPPQVANDRNRLRWTGGFYARRAVWPRDPDIAIIKLLAKKHLLSLFPSGFDDTLFDVSFFDEGAFNKIYRISYKSHSTSYMFRVTLPLDPFFKVESEAATLTFLRAKTSIPVARVIAWDSSCDTDLGFEWLLTEMIDGVPLYDVWRQIPWERKLTLNEDLAKMIAQLRSHKFNSIGSLYFTEALRRGADERKIADKVEDSTQGNEESATNGSSLSEYETFLRTPLPTNKDEERGVVEKSESADDFALGHMFDPIFFDETRMYLFSNRGPFQTSLQWQQAAVAVQLEYINKGLSVLASEADDDKSEYDSDLEEEAPEMIETCHEMLNILPEVFKDEEERAEFVLHHHDLNASNILVDPETFKITGLLDWEMTCVVPAWEATREPKFLEYIVYDWENDIDEPPMPPSWDEEGEHQYAIEARDRWDYKLLRRHFDATFKKVMEGLGQPTHSDPEVTTKKQEIARNIWNLTDNWEWVRKWIRTYHNGGVDPESDCPDDDDDESRKETSDTNAHSVLQAEGQMEAQRPEMHQDSEAFPSEVHPALETLPSTHTNEEEEPFGPATERNDVQSDNQEKSYTQSILEEATTAISTALKEIASSIARETKTESPVLPEIPKTETDNADLNNKTQEKLGES